MNNFNPCMEIDSYNASHPFMMYPNDYHTAYIYNRKSALRICGLAGLIHQLLSTKITPDMVDEAIEYALDNGISFPENLFYNILDNLDGKIPLQFEMLPEFIVIPQGTPFCKIQNTEPGYASLVTMWEGYLSHAYYTSSLYTRARWLYDQGVKNVHNFGYRGERVTESAVRSAWVMGLLYEGTDTFAANKMEGPLYELYTKPKFKTIAAASHAVIQSYPSEMEAYRTIIKKYSGAAVAFPIDTYNPERFIRFLIPEVIKLATSYNTKVFFRVDSGDLLSQPRTIFEAIEHFAGSFKENFGVIIGDNLEVTQIAGIDRAMRAEGSIYSMYNQDTIQSRMDRFYYGWGSNFYNDITRDTSGWVMKLGLAGNRATMKTTKGKESLGGDLFVEIRKNKYFIVSTDPKRSSYIDYKYSTQFDYLSSDPEPELIIDPLLRIDLEDLKKSL